MKKFHIIFLLIQKILLNENLKMIIEIYRHGARREYVNINPIVESYPNKNTGKGDITNNGIKTHYLLGLSIYKNYKNFFGKEINNNNFEIISSGKNRTITSAISQMMGIYNYDKNNKLENNDENFYNPPFKNYKKKIKEEIALPKNLKIFPIKNSIKKTDTFFIVEESCPNFRKKQNEKMQELFTKYSKEFEFSYKIIEKFMPAKKWIKKQNYDLKSSFSICDYIITNIYNDPNFPYPKIILEHCNYIYFFTIFLYSKIGEMRKTYLHELGVLILKRFRDKVKGKSELKGLFVSGSDSNIGCFLMALNPRNLDCILKDYREKFLRFNNRDLEDRNADLKSGNINFNKEDYFRQENVFYGKNNYCVNFIKFSSNLILELTEEAETYFITLKYNNSLINFLNGKAKVSFEEFENIIQEKMFDKNFNKNCGADFLMEKQINGIFLSFLMITTYVFIILFFIGNFFIYKKCVENKKKKINPTFLQIENSNL